MGILSFFIISCVVLIICLYGGFIIWVSWPISFMNIDKAGVFGDSFGVITSLFSGLAFSGIIITILLQRKELQLQRKELALTRGEIRNQIQTAKQQNFENMFFQMLRIHNEIVNSIDLSRSRQGSETITSGRDCFVVFYNRIKNFYDHNANDPNTSEQEKLDLSYRSFWGRAEQELGHYFRYLYTIFKFIKQSETVNKRAYSNIVRAQLSDQELLILFYNCLYKFGVEKFKPLAEEFALFDNLPQELLLNTNHINFYKSEAFGEG